MINYKLVKIEIDSSNLVFVEYESFDDIEFKFSTHRDSFHPGDDISTQAKQIQNICAAIWSVEFIETYITAHQE